jgi:hypothetical protein
VRGSPFQVEASPLLLQLLAPSRCAHQLLLQFLLERFRILVAGLKDAPRNLSGLQTQSVCAPVVRGFGFEPGCFFFSAVWLMCAPASPRVSPGEVLLNILRSFSFSFSFFFPPPFPPPPPQNVFLISPLLLSMYLIFLIDSVHLGS